MAGTDAPGNDPAALLRSLSEKLRGPALLELLNIKGTPAPEALVRRVADLKAVVAQLCAHLPPGDPARGLAAERLRDVERLLEDPLEWHVLVRAHELGADPTDTATRATIENAFYEEHVPRAVWLVAPVEGATSTELRRSMRLPVLAEVDLQVGDAWTRLRTENLSRSGLCLVEVPTSFEAATVKLTLHLNSGEEKLALSGKVAWRRGRRAGIAFDIEPSQQWAIDKALQNHFLALRAVVDRWLQLSPQNPAAQASSALCAFHASVLAAGKQAAVERLEAVARDVREGKHAPEVQLALAKMCLEQGDLERAEAALHRAARGASTDLRYQSLVEAVAQRRGRKRLSLRPLLDRSAAGVRAAGAALLVLGLIGSLTFAYMTVSGPYVDHAVPIGGLPCARLKLLQANALCYIDAARYAAMAPKERALSAGKTLSDLASSGVSIVTVYGTNDEGVLDVFDDVLVRSANAAR